MPDTVAGDASPSFTAPFSPLAPARVEQLLRENYALTSRSIERLATERDDTFHVTVARPQRDEHLVVKVAHPADSAVAIDEQLAVLRALAERFPTVPVPRVTLTRDGAATVAVESADGPRWMRVLSWLEGEPVGHRPRSAADLDSLGATQAHFAHAVATVGAELGEPPRDSPPSPWNLLAVGTSADRLHEIADPTLQRLARDVLAHAQRITLPRLRALPPVLAHNDFHGDNVLVHPSPVSGAGTSPVADAPVTVSGILDFGDLTRTPRIADLAVAASYARGVADEQDSTLAEHPWAAAEVLSAAAARTWGELGSPLTREERALLPELILLRMAQRAALNSAIAAVSRAEERTYAERNLARLARDLADLTAHPPPPTLGAAS